MLYYVDKTQYGNFGISLFAAIWPQKIPYAFFNSADSTFTSQIDCVGYGTRLLSAVGDATAANNAYLNLMDTIRARKSAPFAGRGYVAMAYQFAVAFPTLTGNGQWQYISGNVAVDSIISYNRKLSKDAITTYSGVKKGNFQMAQPGDILSFGYGPSSKDNGHFMVIAHSPVLLNADSLSLYFKNKSMDTINNLLASYNAYGVPVFDCSGTYAHFFDSRTKMSGIGHGTLVILTSKQENVPMGFVFGPEQASDSSYIGRGLVGKQAYAISVGRFTPVKATAK